MVKHWLFFLWGVLSFILYARPFDQKLGSLLIYFFICTRPFNQSQRLTLTLNLFFSELFQYFVCSTAFMFCPLQSYPYISYTIFIHRSGALIFCTLYPSLYEVLALWTGTWYGQWSLSLNSFSTNWSNFEENAHLQ